MKRFNQNISFLNLNMRYTRTPLILLLLSMVGLQLGIFYQNMINMSFEKNMTIDWENTTTIAWSMRFEEILKQSYFTQIYYAIFFLTFIVIATIPVRQSMNCKARLTLLRLPIKRTTQFGLQCVHSFFLLFMVWGTQLLVVLAAFGIYKAKVPTDLQMSNGLFLAFIRYDFLRVLYPVTNPIHFLYHLIQFIGISITAAYLGLCIRSKHSYGSSLFVIVLFMWTTNIQDVNTIFHLITTGIMCLFIFAMVKSIKPLLYIETNV